MAKLRATEVLKRRRIATRDMEDQGECDDDYGDDRGWQAVYHASNIRFPHFLLSGSTALEEKLIWPPPEEILLKPGMIVPPPRDVDEPDDGKKGIDPIHKLSIHPRQVPALSQTENSSSLPVAFPPPSTEIPQNVTFHPRQIPPLSPPKFPPFTTAPIPAAQTQLENFTPTTNSDPIPSTDPSQDPPFIQSIDTPQVLSVKTPSTSEVTVPQNPQDNSTDILQVPSTDPAHRSSMWQAEIPAGSVPQAPQPKLQSHHPWHTKTPSLTDHKESSNPASQHPLTKQVPPLASLSKLPNAPNRKQRTPQSSKEFGEFPSNPSQKAPPPHHPKQQHTSHPNQQIVVASSKSKQPKTLQVSLSANRETVSLIPSRHDSTKLEQKDTSSKLSRISSELSLKPIMVQQKKELFPKSEPPTLPETFTDTVPQTSSDPTSKIIVVENSTTDTPQRDNQERDVLPELPKDPKGCEGPALAGHQQFPLWFRLLHPEYVASVRNQTNPAKKNPFRNQTFPGSRPTRNAGVPDVRGPHKTICNHCQNQDHSHRPRPITIDFQNSATVVLQTKPNFKVRPAFHRKTHHSTLPAYHQSTPSPSTLLPQPPPQVRAQQDCPTNQGQAQQAAQGGRKSRILMHSHLPHTHVLQYRCRGPSTNRTCE